MGFMGRICPTLQISLLFCFFVVGEVSVQMGSPKGVKPRVFPKLKRMHKYENLPLHKQLSFDFLASFLFHKKEIFPWEHGNI